ncbi:MAG: hypothetical protein MJ177_04395 [Clostridia bacterium]|nr:hypothetical protein [Clostridia bacterium]
MKLLRKCLCIVISVLMAASSCLVLGVSAADDSSAFGFDISSLIPSDNIGSLDIPDFDDIEALIATGLLSDVKIGPMTLEQIYDPDTDSDWHNIKNNGDINASTLYITMGNLNLYFRNFFNKYYTKEKLYSSETATWLTNKIVDIFFGPDHPQIAVPLESYEIGDQLAFIREVLRKSKSGITTIVDLVQSCWINEEINYLPMCYALGVDIDDIWNKQNAQEVCEEILTAMIDKFLADPLYYIIDVVWAVSRSYNASMHTVIEAALTTRIASADITADEIKQPHEVLNLLFNNNSESNTEKLQFFTAPYAKMGKSGDRVELFYYLFIYALLIGTYKNNENVIKGYENAVNAYNYVKISSEDKGYICDLLEALATCDGARIAAFTANTAINNITDTAKSWIQKIFDRFIEILVGFVEGLDKIFGFKARWE